MNYLYKSNQQSAISNAQIISHNSRTVKHLAKILHHLSVISASVWSWSPQIVASRPGTQKSREFITESLSLLLKKQTVYEPFEI